ncbi:kinase-like domain-containing protein [Cyathus striatus]|nr:kinase-like domain-containing protein [Cyathus striatus]
MACRRPSIEAFASLKVLSGYSSQFSSELNISRHLQQQQESGIWDPSWQGPCGPHIRHIYLQVIDEEPYVTSHFPFQPDASRKVAAQVALGVAYLHKCGIIHGDLYLRNVLYYTPELENASLADVNRIFGKPFTRPIRYRDNDKPSVHCPTTVAYRRQIYPEVEICLSRYADIHVKLCDFGESSLYAPNCQPDKPLKSNMPFDFRAPEIIFHDMVCPAPSMDIWALGVLMYMILENYFPFASSHGKDEMLVSMAYILGKLPDKWWTAWAERAIYFEENGMCRARKQMVPFASLNIRKEENFSDEEVSSFTSLLYKMFHYLPEERIDAEEVVRLIPSDWKKRDVVGNRRVIGVEVGSRKIRRE